MWLMYVWFVTAAWFPLINISVRFILQDCSVLPFLKPNMRGKSLNPGLGSRHNLWEQRQVSPIDLEGKTDLNGHLIWWTILSPSIVFIYLFIFSVFNHFASKLNHAHISKLKYHKMMIHADNSNNRGNQQWWVMHPLLLNLLSVRVCN